jgi:hypothetical protein
MDCWIVIGAASYKILLPDPIGLPRLWVFSTSSEGVGAPPRSFGHDRPHANALLERLPSIDLPRARS